MGRNLRRAGLVVLALLLAVAAFAWGWVTAAKGGALDDSLRRVFASEHATPTTTTPNTATPTAAASDAATSTAAGTERPAQGEERDSAWREKASFFKSFDARARVVMVGDSITDGAEWGEMFPGVSIANRGIDGDTTRGVLERMDGILALHAERAFIMMGINDFIQGRGPDEVFGDYAKIVAALRASGASVVVQSTLQCNRKVGTAYGCANLASKIAALNQRLAGLAGNGVTYVDINARLADAGGLKSAYTYDGVHLNGDGYLVWKTEIAALMR